MALVEIHFHMPPGVLDPATTTRIERIEKQMSDILKNEQAVEASETALESRVTAHEKNLSDLRDSLQTQITALQQGQTDTVTAAASLQALVSKIDAFDPDAAPAPVVTPPVDTTPAPVDTTPAA